MITALWIDDQPNKSFEEWAYQKDINITNKTNVDEGIEELLNNKNKYDAIILDANCVSHRDNTMAPNIKALQYATKQIARNNIELPWFVYSAGGFEGEESIDVIVEGSECSYHSQLWYKKPAEMDNLLEDIKKVVATFPDFQLKEKYVDLFSWYPRTTELLDIITCLETEDCDVFNKIRQELEFLMKLACEKGLCKKEFSGTNLAECSKFMGDSKLSQIIPNYIQRSLHSAVEICNLGSHSTDFVETIKANKAPYVTKSIIYNFLNLVHWFNKTNQEFQEMSQQVEQALANNAPLLEGLTEEEQTEVTEKYLGREFTVKRDDENNYYCDKCRLAYQKASPYLDKKVVLKNIKRNKSSNSSQYPYFAEFEPKEEEVME